MSDVLELVSSYPTKYFYLNELTPYPSNYNHHSEAQIEELRESLETFGQFKPIVTWVCPKNEILPDGNELHEGLNYIICGHGLWQASLRTNIDRLEAKDITGVSREMAEAILVADNAAPLGSEPIPDKLASLLARTRGITAERPGLQAMLGRLKEKAGINGDGDGQAKDVEPQIDKAAQLKEQWGTALGQVWEMPSQIDGRPHRIVCGDCTDRAVVEAVMRGERVRFEFSDPPYELQTRGGGILKDAAQMRAIEAARIDKFDPSILTLITPTALFCCNRPLVPEYIDLAKKLKVAWDICFYKKNNTPPNYGGHMMTDTEYLMLLGEQNPNSGLDKQLYSKAYIGQADSDSVVAWAKPIELVIKYIRLYSHFGDLIVDRFLGTGTTLIAAHNLHRIARGIEIDPGYVAVCLQRYLDLTGIHPRRLSG